MSNGARQYLENKHRKDLIRSFSLNCHINGKQTEPELMKALNLGERKVGTDGRLYVVGRTKSGGLDWHIADPKKRSKKDVENINDDGTGFPDDISKLEFVKNLGGSTGAKLVKDKQGNKFVLKKGNNKAHISEEFLANQIYDVLGINVPEVRLYNGDTMLSKFMENTEVANNVLTDEFRDEIMKNYVADCLLANWDIYKNDNILINKEDGLIYRVDNGGSLRFSAQGREKGEHFSDEVDELDSMISNNVTMASGLTQTDINNQIQTVLSKKKDVLSLIKDKSLKDKMKNVLQFLS